MKTIKTENGHWTHGTDRGCYYFTVSEDKKAEEARLIQEYKDSHPIRTAFHTGKFGYVRAGSDMIDLSRCVYNSKQAAERARARDASISAHQQLAGENPF
jgi:hypothetical protein